METLNNNHKSALMMVRTVALIILAVVGITAMFGGAALILDPSGESMGLKPEGLAGTMFDDYRGPGIILFLAIGVLGLSVAVLTAGNYKNHPILIFYQGLILTGWIMAQVYLLPENHFLQAVYGILGIMLMLLGSYLLLKKDRLNTLY
jgi:hypothetical protein